MVCTAAKLSVEQFPVVLTWAPSAASIHILQVAVPFAVVGSNQVIEIRGRKVRGRMYPWGVVEVENPDHCDFIKLRTMLV